MKKVLKYSMKIERTITILIVVFGIIVYGCQKKEVLSESNPVKSEVNKGGDQNNDSSNTKADYDELCECTGFHLAQDESGNYDCPPPDADCSVIQPCPCDAIAINDPGDTGEVLSWEFSIANFRLFQDALGKNKLKDFFNSEDWIGVFNKLHNESVIHDNLKSGSATVLEYIQADKAFYIVVDTALENSDVVQESDVLMALEVPVSLL